MLIEMILMKLITESVKTGFFRDWGEFFRAWKAGQSSVAEDNVWLMSARKSKARVVKNPWNYVAAIKPEESFCLNWSPNKHVAFPVQERQFMTPFKSHQVATD